MAGLPPLVPRTRPHKGPQLAPLILHGLQAPLFPLSGVPSQAPWEHGRSKKASLPPDVKSSWGDRRTAEDHEGEVLMDQARLRAD